MTRRAIAAGALCAMVATPGIADAHLVVTGLGPIYDGVTHFALSPEDVLPVVGLAFYAGLRGPARSRLLLMVLPAAWVIGGLTVASFGNGLPSLLAPIATACLLLGVGGLLALNLDLSPLLFALAASVLGLVRGAADLSGSALSWSAVGSLLGMSGGVFVVFALAVSVTLPLKRFWMIVAARVTGSWMAAVGLLLVGWVLRYGARVQ